MVEAEKLGAGAGGAAFLCPAGRDLESPTRVVLKVPHSRSMAFMEVFEMETALKVQEAGLRTFCLAPDEAADVINEAALALPDAGLDRSSQGCIGRELQRQLARQSGVQVSRLGVPALKVLETRWNSEPRLLYALAFNVVDCMKQLNSCALPTLNM